MSRKATKYFVVHCSATRANMDVGAKDIRRWHLDRGWSDIGYHYVIRRDGRVEAGRKPEDSIGSHVAGHNSNTLGICLVGGVGDFGGKGSQPQNNFTPAQFEALRALCAKLLKKYPGATILGHRDFPRVAKACPSFDARAWAASNGLPAAPALRGGGVTYGIASTGGLAGSDQIVAAGDAIDANAERLSGMLDVAQGKLELVAGVFKYGGYAVAIVAALAGAYALWRGGVMAWRWYRGEGDFGADAPADEYAAEGRG